MKHTEYPFLLGGGEMGKLIREYDWASTSVGDPSQWPNSLRAALSIVLSSNFPMFIWWGHDFLQFYNDAYRPSLGNNGKHPKALGQSGKECWPEIWDIIYPLIKQVRESGAATWSEDQLIPIYRNGKLEDVYWTFGYSPIRGEEGNVEGVLVVCHETTAKVLAVKNLTDSERRFRAMADNIPNLAWMANADGWIYWYNQQWYTYTGTTPEQMEGWGWQAVHDPKELPTVVKNWQASIETGKDFEMVFPLKGADGKFRKFLTRVVAMRDEEGKIYQWFGTNTDVTNQINIERSLKQSEERLRSVIESAPFPIGVYVGREMRIQMVNQSIMKVWGKGYDVVGKLYSEVLPEVENQNIYQQLDEVYITGKPFHARNQRVDLLIEGALQSFYFNYSFTPLFDGEGKVYGVMNTAADVTDLNVAKQKVEQSEKNLRNMILQSPVAMCILLGKEYVIEVANEKIIELWGKTPAQVLGKKLLAGIPEVKDQGIIELLDNVCSTGVPFVANELKIDLERKGKMETTYLNFVYEPYRDGEDKIIGVLAVATEVTEQVLARHKIEDVVAERTKELAQTNTELQKSNAELAQFAYIASHDLQEPLRKISTFSQMLESSLGDKIESHAKNYLDKILKSTLRMNALIRDVLKYSELEKTTNAFVEVDLNAVVESVKADYDLLIEQKSAEINCYGLPKIQAVPVQMAQLFSNLIGNSLKFTRKNIKPVITIRTHVLSKNEIEQLALAQKSIRYFRIEFSDNGIGFKAEYAKNIFNIFQRLHRKSEYEGTGIGLAMCKKIALNHHGGMNADGSTENGAVFNVILPERQSEME